MLAATVTTPGDAFIAFSLIDQDSAIQ